MQRNGANRLIALAIRNNPPCSVRYVILLMIIPTVGKTILPDTSFLERKIISNFFQNIQLYDQFKKGIVLKGCIFTNHSCWQPNNEFEQTTNRKQNGWTLKRGAGVIDLAFTRKYLKKEFV